MLDRPKHPGQQPLTSAQVAAFRAERATIDHPAILAGDHAELARHFDIARRTVTAKTGVPLEDVEVAIVGPLAMYREMVRELRGCAVVYVALLGAAQGIRGGLPPARYLPLRNTVGLTQELLQRNLDEVSLAMDHELHHAAQHRLGLLEHMLTSSGGWLPFGRRFLDWLQRSSEDTRFMEGHASFGSEFGREELYPSVRWQKTCYGQWKTIEGVLNGSQPRIKPRRDPKHLRRRLERNRATSIDAYERVEELHRNHPEILQHALRTEWVRRLLLSESGAVEVPVPAGATDEALTELWGDVEKVAALNPKHGWLHVQLKLGD